MIQRALAAIALCNSLGDARETARVALQRSIGRRLSLQEVTRWGRDHVWDHNHGAFADAEEFFTIDADTSEDEEYDEERALEEAGAEQERVLNAELEAQGLVGYY